MPEVVDYLRHRNIRCYVTLNTLIFSDELDAVRSTAERLITAGVDAVLVQDLGLLRLLKTMCPELEVHASTQMTLTEGRSIEWARRMGISRVVLPRELSIDEIRKVRALTDLPLEVFIHGALCVAYSGQCLTSESIGGRSANRGRCAQACRLPYDMYVDDKPIDLGNRSYLLSPKDLAGYDMVADLAELGVCSVKIEGRLKSAYYVAAATAVYRRALDEATQGRPFIASPEEIEALEQSFSRGFSRGFLDGVNHQQLVQGHFPKHRGVRLGHVVGRTRRGLLVELDAGRNPPQNGDGVVFDQGRPDQDEQGGRIYSIDTLSNRNGQVTVELILAPGQIQIEAVDEGSLVWKTDDPRLERRLRQTWSAQRTVHRQPIHARVVALVGRPLEVHLTTPQGITASALGQEPLAAARSRPIDEATVRLQLERMGETPFELADLHLVTEPPRGETDVAGSDASPRAMVPKSMLNELRRAACSQLQKLLAGEPRTITPGTLETLRNQAAAEVSQAVQRSRPASGFDPDEHLPKLTVLTRSLEQMNAVLTWQGIDDLRAVQTIYCDFEDVRRYADAVTAVRQHQQDGGSSRIILATPRIIKPGEDGLLAQVARNRPDGVLVRNHSAVAWMQAHAPDLPLIGDFGLNLTNELTAGVFARNGLMRMTPSHDLTWSQLASMLRHVDARWFEMVIHQHMPMFHMEHCIFAAVLSNGKDYRDCGRPCDHHQVDLADRTGVRNPLQADVGCRNTLFNGVAQSAAEYVPRMLDMGLRWFRVELLRETAPEAKRLLDSYARVLIGRQAGRRLWQELKVLSQVGLTRGTLDG